MQVCLSEGITFKKVSLFALRLHSELLEQVKKNVFVGN